MAWNIPIAGVCVFRLGEIKGWVMQRDKRINRRSKFFVVVGRFCCLDGAFTVQYTVEPVDG